MEKTYKRNIENKKQEGVFNRISKIKSYFTSFLKLNLAIALKYYFRAQKLLISLALFFVAAFLISGAGVIVEDGALNVSNDLFIDTNTLFVLPREVQARITASFGRSHTIPGPLWMTS